MRQWDEVYDKHYIRDMQDLQVCEMADDFKVPPSWIRQHCSPWDLGQWAEYQEIKQDRIDEQVSD